MNIIRYELPTPDASGEIVTSTITVHHRVASNAVRAKLRPVFEANQEALERINAEHEAQSKKLGEELGEEWRKDHPAVSKMLTDYAQALHDQVVEMQWNIFDVIVDRSQLTTQDKELLSSEHFRTNCDLEEVREFVKSFRGRAQI